MFWMIYQDNARMKWDAVEDDSIGAIGSHWEIATKQEAKEFVAEMSSEQAIASGWFRGHDWAPRF